MRFLFVSSSPREGSLSRKLARFGYDHAIRRHDEHELDWLDLGETRVEPFRGFDAEYDDVTRDAVRRLLACDGLFVATPVYNGSYASSVKSLLEFVPQKRLAGRVAALAVSGGGERGLMKAQSDLVGLLTYFLVHVVPRPVFATRAQLAGRLPEDVAERVRSAVDELVAESAALRGARIERDATSGLRKEPPREKA